MEMNWKSGVSGNLKKKKKRVIEWYLESIDRKCIRLRICKLGKSFLQHRKSSRRSCYGFQLSLFTRYLLLSRTRCSHFHSPNFLLQISFPISTVFDDVGCFFFIFRVKLGYNLKVGFFFGFGISWAEPRSYS